MTRRKGAPRVCRAGVRRRRARAAPRRSQAGLRQPRLRPSSSANNGLPSVASTILRRSCRCRLSSSRSVSMRRVAPRLSGPTSIRFSGASARSTGAVRPGRLASTKKTVLSSRRRAAKASASPEGASSHWRSSTATSNGPSAASARSAFRKPNEIAPRSVGSLSGSTRRSATSSAASWGAGTPSRLRRSTPSSRSIRPAKDSCASAPLARVETTRIPRSCAAPIAASQSVVLPIPGSPVSTSAREPVPPPRYSSTSASSGARPTGPPVTLLAAAMVRLRRTDLTWPARKRSQAFRDTRDRGGESRAGLMPGRECLESCSRAQLWTRSRPSRPGRRCRRSRADDGRRHVIDAKLPATVMPLPPFPVTVDDLTESKSPER